MYRYRAHCNAKMSSRVTFEKLHHTFALILDYSLLLDHVF